MIVFSPSRSKKYKSKPNILVGIIQPVKSAITIWCRFKTLAGQLLCTLYGQLFLHTLKTGVPADKTFSVSWFHSKLCTNTCTLFCLKTLGFWITCLEEKLPCTIITITDHWTTFFWFSVKYQSAMLHNNLICLASNLVKTHLLQRKKGHHQMQTQSKWNWHLNPQLVFLNNGQINYKTF